MEKKIARRSFLKALAACSAGLGLAACGSGSSSAAESVSVSAAGGSASASYTLMYGHAQTETHPYQEAFKAWAAAVEERTGGDMVVDIYPSNTLGSEEDIINSFKDSDTNWGYNTDFARLGTYVSELALFNVPYFVENMEDLNAVKELDCVQEWLAELETTCDVKVLSLNLVQGYRNVVCGKEVRSPADLSGVILRSPNTDIWRAAISSLGCSVQGMGRGDIYNNLTNKVIDGFEDVYPCIISESYYEIDSCKVISETQHILLLNPTVVDAGWFSTLPEDYQQILMEECDKASAACSEKMIGSYAEECKQKCIEEGMEVLPPEEIDLDAFRAAAQTAYEELNLTDAYRQVMSALGR